MMTGTPPEKPSSAESASERQHDAELRDVAADLRDEAADRRDLVSDDRDDAARSRDDAGDTRDGAALRRDQTALMRDVAAARRDVQADARDRAALEGEAERAGGPMSVRTAASNADAAVRSALARRDAAGDRGHAARDREAGAAERIHAEGDRGTALSDRDRADADRSSGAHGRVRSAEDRDTAQDDRGQATLDLEHASLDGLTGVYTRAAGLLELQREIDRASRSGAPLALAFVDVDGLKAVNDAGGHAAGDRVLVRVAAALQARLRPYDLVVRYGGDEFVCALAGMTPAEATARLREVNTTLSAGSPPASVSVGLSDLRTGDTLDVLIARADDDLYRGRAAEPRR